VGLLDLLEALQHEKQARLNQEANARAAKRRDEEERARRAREHPHGDLLDSFEAQGIDGQAMTALLHLARSPSTPEEHRRVIGLLGQSDDPRAFAPLFETFVNANRPGYDKDAHKTWSLARSVLLEHAAEGMALFALTESKRMEDASMRVSAIELACEIGGRTLFKAVISAFRARELKDLQPSTPMRLMIDGLLDRRSEWRHTCWGENDEDWVRTSLETLVRKDPNRTVRLAGIFGLEYLRDPASIATLKAATRDKEPAVRRTAMQALSAFPDAVTK
jgi:hypothetical protein